jgi:hypothetical protein
VKLKIFKHNQKLVEWILYKWSYKYFNYHKLS